eukprot:TRINITY_DN6245_c0_g1_i1.p1 TRINITY_DN6245_c0_g1~~TRINITY_DN6245_c0_g1_i1.p1  ORF type:complete len:181 (-),score=74.21 TRINITY_DN6245_c0_g1_i1:25-543(-)
MDFASFEAWVDANPEKSIGIMTAVMIVMAVVMLWPRLFHKKEQSVGNTSKDKGKGKTKVQPSFKPRSSMNNNVEGCCGGGDEGCACGEGGCGSSSSSGDISIVYATYTNTSQTLAKRLAKEAAEKYGIIANVYDVKEYDWDQLPQETFVVFVVATYKIIQCPESGGWSVGSD